MGVQQALEEAAAERRALNPSFAAAATASAAAAGGAATAAGAPLKAAAPDSFALQLGVESDDEDEPGRQLPQTGADMTSSSSSAAAADAAAAAAAATEVGWVGGKRAAPAMYAAVLPEGLQVLPGGQGAAVLAMDELLLGEPGEDVAGEQWEGGSDSDEYYCGSLSSSSGRSSMDGMPVLGAGSSRGYGNGNSNSSSSSSSSSSSATGTSSGTAVISNSAAVSSSSDGDDTNDTTSHSGSDCDGNNIKPAVGHRSSAASSSSTSSSGSSSSGSEAAGLCVIYAAAAAGDAALL